MTNIAVNMIKEYAAAVAAGVSAIAVIVGAVDIFILPAIRHWRKLMKAKK